MQCVHYWTKSMTRASMLTVLSLNHRLQSLTKDSECRMLVGYSGVCACVYECLCVCVCVCVCQTDVSHLQTSYQHV